MHFLRLLADVNVNNCDLCEYFLCVLLQNQLKYMIFHKIYIWNLCDLHEQFWCVFSYYQHKENFSTRVTFEIFETLMNNIYVSAQEISMSKWFSTKKLVQKLHLYIISWRFSISNFHSLIFSDNISCFKICLWQFFYKIDIELWLIIMWDFQLIWIQCWFGIFFQIFSHHICYKKYYSSKSSKS